jgi:NAD(P)-dependent dehydrogenase (short-subunit alcohol dehydrogenase family)
MAASMLGIFDLSGKVALITGSSRGIGKAIAESMAEAGASVVISSRKEAACIEAAAGINAKYSEPRAIPIAASISNRAALENLVAETRTRLGRIDILVCNAASNPYSGSLLNITDDVFRKTLDNNVVATNRLIALTAPEMVQRKAGSVIIISSVGAMIGSTTLGAYSVSKAADLQLMRNLALELAPQGVRVNAITPGPIRTDFSRAMWEDPAREAQWVAGVPLGRVGLPRDVAGAAIFLASAAGEYITGHSIVVDGGMTVQRGSIPKQTQTA